MLNAIHGSLVEYNKDKMELTFEFNPQTISRTRSVTIKQGDTPGTRVGFDFASAKEAPLAAQGVSFNPESFSLTILLDATERMSNGNLVALKYGIQPEIDILRTMVEPKSNSASGAQTLSSLGKGSEKAVAKAQTATVLLFMWGPHILPVFLTEVRVDSKAFRPSLVPYRAEVGLNMQIIESNNHYYIQELKRQLDTAGLYTGLPIYKKII